MSSSVSGLSLLMVVSEDWYFLSHRLHLAREALRRGMLVTIATGPGNRGAEIEAAGVTHIVVPMNRRGTNPVGEIRTIRTLAALMRKLRPDLVHLVAVKPVVCGNIAASLAGVSAVLSAIPGMGYLYLGGGFGRRLMREIYEGVFKIFVKNKPGARVLVQNSEDLRLLTERGMACPEQLVLITGSGVDLQRFEPTSEPPGGPIVVLSHTRMLWDKGLGELAEAVRLLRRRRVPDFIVRLVGAPDPANPAAIQVEQLTSWSQEGLIEWLGRREDIPAQLRNCHLACLPSYREGAPLSLLEAAAAGRAIVTTDVPGCREVVRDGDNGLLVPARDAKRLADALEKLIVDAELRSKMGARGRERAEREFSSELVNERIIATYLQMTTRKSKP